HLAGRAYRQPAEVGEAARKHRLLLILQAPKPDRIVPPAVGQDQAVAAEGDLHRCSPDVRWSVARRKGGRRTEGLHAAKRPAVGEVDLSVLEAGRGEEAVIGTESHRVDVTIVPAEGRLLLAGRNVP